MSSLCVWRPLRLEGISERCSHTASFVRGELFIIGGAVCSEGVFEHYGDVWRVNPTTGACTQVTICPTSRVFTARRGHSAVVYRDRWILVFGGISTVNPNVVAGGAPVHNNEQLMDDLCVFDTETSRWTVPPRDPQPSQARHWPMARRGHMCTVYKDRLFIWGGYIQPIPHPVWGFGVDLYVSSILSSIDLIPLFAPPTSLSSSNSSSDDGGDSDDSDVTPASTFCTWRQDVIESYVEILNQGRRADPGHQQGHDLRYIALSSSVLSGSKWIFWGGTLSPKIEQASGFYLDLDEVPLSGAFRVIAYEGLGGPPPRADVPSSRFCGASCGLCDNRVVLLFGGSDIRDVSNVYADLFTLQPQTRGEGDDWTRGAVSELVQPHVSCSTPPSRNAATLTAVGDRTALLFGGGKYNSKYYCDAFLLDLVTVEPSVRTPTPPPPSSCPSSSSPSVRENTKILEYFATLVDRPKWCDCTLRLDDGTVIEAHRVVLAARSQYFRKLLDGNFSESATSCFRLPNTDSAAFAEVVHYYYTCAFTPAALATPDAACRLLVVADMLQEAAVYQICCRKLQSFATAIATTPVSSPADKCHAVTSLLQLVSFAECMSLQAGTLPLLLHCLYVLVLLSGNVSLGEGGQDDDGEQVESLCRSLHGSSAELVQRVRSVLLHRPESCLHEDLSLSPTF